MEAYWWERARVDNRLTPPTGVGLFVDLVSQTVAMAGSAAANLLKILDYPGFNGAPAGSLVTPEKPWVPTDWFACKISALLGLRD